MLACCVLSRMRYNVPISVKRTSVWTHFPATEDYWLIPGTLTLTYPNGKNERYSVHYAMEI
jgi:hypothetical protein